MHRADVTGAAAVAAKEALSRAPGSRRKRPFKGRLEPIEADKAGVEEDDRERNRSAGMRFRKRREEYIQSMQQSEVELTEQNIQLQLMAQELMDRNAQLRAMLLQSDPALREHGHDSDPP